MSIPKETLLQAYRTMKTIREFEERVNAEIMNGQIVIMLTRLRHCGVFSGDRFIFRKGHGSIFIDKANAQSVIIFGL